MSNPNRKFKGNPPPDPWIEVAAANGWRLFLNPEGNNPPWYNFKLVSSKPRLKKANYWLSYNAEYHRLSVTPASTTLIQHRTEVYVWTLASMKRAVLNAP